MGRWADGQDLWPVLVVGVTTWMFLVCLPAPTTALLSRSYRPVGDDSSGPSQPSRLRTGYKLGHHLVRMLEGRRKVVVYVQCSACSVVESRGLQAHASRPGIAILDLTSDRRLLDSVRGHLHKSSIVIKASREDVGLLAELPNGSYLEINTSGIVTKIE